MTASDTRLEQIRAWLRMELGLAVVRMEPASADASFRRYFRVWREDGATRVVMDAPPDKEDTGSFLKVAGLLARCGVHVPHIDAHDAARGLVLLEDLGSVHYLAQLRAGADADALYGDAFEALLRIQLRGRDAAHELPAYDRATLEREMAAMPQWFCERHLQLQLNDEDRGIIADGFGFLANEALAQPIVFVHRDYHSRNLMVLPSRNPGVVDFQDALAGPVAYDLVSLLKDCYIQWPRARVQGWVSAYRARLGATARLGGASELEFQRWFDLIGLQRHLKVLGYFARLWYRDGKSAYLADLPRTLEYVREVVRSYQELQHFGLWLERRVVPLFAAANARAMGAPACP